MLRKTLTCAWWQHPMQFSHSHLSAMPQPGIGFQSKFQMFYALAMHILKHWESTGALFYTFICSTEVLQIKMLSKSIFSHTPVACWCVLPAFPISKGYLTWAGISLGSLVDFKESSESQLFLRLVVSVLLTYVYIIHMLNDLVMSQSELNLSLSLGHVYFRKSTTIAKVREASRCPASRAQHGKICLGTWDYFEKHCMLHIYKIFIVVFLFLCILYLHAYVSYTCTIQCILYIKHYKTICDGQNDDVFDTLLHGFLESTSAQAARHRFGRCVAVALRQGPCTLCTQFFRSTDHGRLDGSERFTSFWSKAGSPLNAMPQSTLSLRRGQGKHSRDLE